MTDHVRLTHLLRNSDYDLWVRLRALLAARNVDVVHAVLVELLPDGSDHEFGQVICDEGQVYRFNLFYDRGRKQGARTATISHWTDVTDRWRTEPLAERTASAMIWRAPERRTDISI